MPNTRTISFAGQGGSFELAVNPKQIQVTQANNTKTIDLLNTGTVAIAGNRGLTKTTIDTFLPASKSPFYKNKSPAELLGLIKKWKNGKLPVRLIISGTDINTMFLIDSSKEEYLEGQADIKVSWSFVEYRPLNVAAVASIAACSNNGAELSSRAADREIPKSVTIKNGDSLWALAVKYYGNGGQWKKIADANNIENENKLKIGMVVELPQ